MPDPLPPSILAALVQGPPRWRGTGLNEAQQAFEARSSCRLWPCPT